MHIIFIITLCASVFLFYMWKKWRSGGLINLPKNTQVGKDSFRTRIQAHSSQTPILLITSLLWSSRPSWWLNFSCQPPVFFDSSHVSTLYSVIHQPVHSLPWRTFVKSLPLSDPCSFVCLLVLIALSSHLVPFIQSSLHVTVKVIFKNSNLIMLSPCSRAF